MRYLRKYPGTVVICISSLFFIAAAVTVPGATLAGHLALIGAVIFGTVVVIGMARS